MYFDDLTPSTGCRQPRAWLRSSRPRLSLNGRWKFELWSDPADAPAVPDVREDCGELEIPGHWVLQGHDRPRYTNTAFPFPIDPPRTPDANPTGDYWRWFDLPGDWPADGAVLRFDGVDSCFKVWLNGTEVGTAKGSRLPSEFDVGELLRPGQYWTRYAMVNSNGGSRYFVHPELLPPRRGEELRHLAAGRP